jgi:hypothetical protein
MAPAALWQVAQVDFSACQGMRAPEVMELATSARVPWHAAQLPSAAVWRTLRLHLAVSPGWQS